MRNCNTGTNALFFAAQGGFIDILTVLLDEGAPINQPSKDGGTPLIVASQCGHLDIVLELLRRGADPHMAMRDRATAVFVGAQNGHASVVRALLQSGARPNMWSRNIYGFYAKIFSTSSHAVSDPVILYTRTKPRYLTSVQAMLCWFFYSLWDIPS
ncbi:Ankyrin repeat domain-containing protein 29 [Armadillidium vulgare]|nr:Ankyrin repeat domain-containing protein 29 [Armadillidium vulgare]